MSWLSLWPGWTSQRWLGGGWPWQAERRLALEGGAKQRRKRVRGRDEMALLFVEVVTE
jgi:hypothetical protein